MNGLYATPRMIQREHAERLRNAARSRQSVEVARRLKIQSRLRKAIAEAVRLEGDTRELAAEFAGIVRCVERRLARRSC